MHRHFFSLRIAAFVVLAAIAVATIDLWLHGFVVVADPERQIARATVRHVDGDVAMRAIADGFWAIRPQRAGRVVLTCVNGAEVPGQDVAPGRIVRLTVKADACTVARARGGA